MNKFLTHNWLAHEINRKCTLSVLKYVKGDLLDIGCGEKPYFDILTPHINEYVGLDMSDTLHAKDAIDVYGTACNQPFKDSSFDSVVSFRSIFSIFLLRHVPLNMSLRRRFFSSDVFSLSGWKS